MENDTWIGRRRPGATTLKLSSIADRVVTELSRRRVHCRRRFHKGAYMP
jgi:hypothetical protein